jgi:hypothetical protein
MASNCAHLFTSLDRYLLCIKGTQDEKNSKLAKHYKKLTFKKVIKTILLISLILNIVKFFQYRVSGNYSEELKTFPLVNVAFYANPLLNALNIFVYFVLNNLFILVSTLIVEIRLYLFLRKAIRSKANLVVRHNNNNNNNNNSQTTETTQDEKFLRLVILNGLLYFAFHILDFILSIFLAYFKFINQGQIDIIQSSQNDQFLKTLKYIFYLSVCDFVSLCSYLSYFFIYVSYDKNYKASLMSLIFKK